MSKNYIVVLTNYNKKHRRIDCKDIRKIHYVAKNKRPDLPKYTEDDLQNIDKIVSPTDTCGSL